jgi:hypothetical protein
MKFLWRRVLPILLENPDPPCGWQLASMMQSHLWRRLSGSRNRSCGLSWELQVPGVMLMEANKLSECNFSRLEVIAVV